MLPALFARTAASAVPWRLLGLAAAGLAVAAAIAFHISTTSSLETAVSKAKSDHAAALADIARRDTAIADLERAIAMLNDAVYRLQSDGQARARRAATAARQELARPALPAPTDVAALNLWIRQSHGDTQ